MGKKFITVRGYKEEKEMGYTLPQGHLLVDIRNWLKPSPKELSLKHLVSQPVTLENRGEVVYKGFYFEDNLIQTDVNIAIQEAIINSIKRSCHKLLNIIKLCENM